MNKKQYQLAIICWRFSEILRFWKVKLPFEVALVAVVGEPDDDLDSYLQEHLWLVVEVEVAFLDA